MISDADGIARCIYPRHLSPPLRWTRFPHDESSAQTADANREIATGFPGDAQEWLDS